MLTETPSVTQLSHVISQSAAPAFLLGALGAFIAILISRLNRIVDRTVILNGIPDDDTVRCRLKADLLRLMQRAAMMNRAIFWAVIASISVTFRRDRRFFNGVLSDTARTRSRHLLHDFARRVHRLAGRFCP
jgi:Protein of unknown function (DUF2721)